MHHNIYLRRHLTATAASKKRRLLPSSPQAIAGDHQMGLGGLEDVMDGSGCQHLPHSLVDDLLRVARAHSHGAQEAHGKNLLHQ